MTDLTLNASALVLAAAATVGTFGGPAALAKHQYVHAVRIAAGAAPPGRTLAAPLRRHA